MTPAAKFRALVEAAPNASLIVILVNCAPEIAAWMEMAEDTLREYPTLDTSEDDALYAKLCEQLGGAK